MKHCTWWKQKVKQTHVGSKLIFLRIRKIKAISSVCSLRCAFCFPMVASCCLLLSPLYHCLDSLRPPQEGKVDIYVEAFRLTILRRSFCPDSVSLPLILTFIHSALGKNGQVQTAALRLNRWGFLCVFCIPQALAGCITKRSNSTHFPWSSSQCSSFSNWSGKMFHLHLALECVPVIANCRSGSLLPPDWLRV